MMDLNQTLADITFSKELIGLLPSILFGFLIGIANYFKPFLTESIDQHSSFRRMVGSGINSAVLCFTIYMLLDFSDFSFMAKLGMSCAISFLGIDKALETIERLLAAWKGSKNA